jgi:hypothetical protein
VSSADHFHAIEFGNDELGMNISPALAKGRQHQAQNIQTEVEIAAETLLTTHCSRLRFVAVITRTSE